MIIVYTITNENTSVFNEVKFHAGTGYSAVILLTTPITILYDYTPTLHANKILYIYVNISHIIQKEKFNIQGIFPQEFNNTDKIQ